jgi:dipeptidyl aminopeptidase/acylaminoacyl peptidase
VPAQQPAGAAPAGWQQPPEPITRLVLADPAPEVQLSPDRRFLLFVQRDALPDLADLARPHLKLAGLRVDPRTRGPQLGGRVKGMVVRSLADDRERKLPVPEGRLGAPLWSADGKRLCFTRTTDDAIELWVADVEAGQVHQIPGVVLNAVLGSSVHWMPDQRTLLCTLRGPGVPPPEPPAPAGPSVQETKGRKAQVRTFQDLLQDSHDADLFEFYGTSQLATVDADSGKVTPFGRPALWNRIEASPDGALILATALHRPFSYLVTAGSFPARTVVMARDGSEVTLPVTFDHGLEDTVPIGGVATGPRGINWIPVRPHALCWTEALDDGDPKKKVERRDRVQVLAETTGAPEIWYTTEHRAQGISYGETEGLALSVEFDRDTRKTRLWRANANQLNEAPVLLWDRSTQDAYGDPGTPVHTTRPDGQSLVRMQGHTLFLSGRGASKEGDRPFLDAFDLQSGQKQRLFQCGTDCLEQFTAFLDADCKTILVQRETPTEPPNVFRVEFANGRRTQLTRFTDPAQQFLATVHKELVHYQRKDGVPLSGTLYLPPAKAGEKLPALVWAYPAEFNQASDAGQVRGSPFRYQRLAGISHLFLLCLGYAVLDDAAFPIVGPVRTANDTFVDQLVQNAQAAVDVLVAHGADPRRIAVAGHSYGAFMTANLLAHCNLFAAGIARSGAYNRTLTPFGFQNEERTYWEAPQLYHDMSPFSYADKIKAPLLMIHGEDDNNPGTFPMQSQRLYVAIQGHGGTARLCLLPHEAHGYRSRECVLQCLWEMADWMDRYVRNRPPTAEASGSKQ